MRRRWVDPCQMLLQFSPRTGTGHNPSRLARDLWAMLDARRHFPEQDCPVLHQHYTDGLRRCAEAIISATAQGS